MVTKKVAGGDFVVFGRVEELREALALRFVSKLRDQEKRIYFLNESVEWRRIKGQL